MMTLMRFSEIELLLRVDFELEGGKERAYY